MADDKSKFVNLLLSFSKSGDESEMGMPSREMITTDKKPNFEFIFSTKNKVAMTKKTIERIHFYNLMDGYQFLECGLPGWKDQTFVFTWDKTAQIFLQKVQSVLDQESGFSSVVYSKQTNVLAFDCSRNVCNAKKPKQNSRRMQRILPPKRAQTDPSKMKKMPIVVFPFEEIDQFVVRNRDLMPAEWRKFMTFGAYKGKIVDFLAAKILDPLNLFLNNPESQKVQLWMNGTFKSRRSENLTELNTKFQNIGEYDFFAIRYMNYFIQQHIKKRTELVGHKKTTKEKSLYDFSTIHDFETLVFKIHSDDTDLLLYSLYFLEFVKYKYNIHDSFLPKIIIVHPKFKGSTIHVTYLYIVIKHQLEKVNNRELKTVMRSFIMGLISWGNDILPNPPLISPDTWLQTYVQFNMFMDHSFVSLNTDVEKAKYEHGCSIDGKKFKLLYFLAYASKHLKPDQIDKIWGYYDPRSIDYAGLEKYIISIVNKKSINEKNKIPSQRTIKARMIISNLMLYSIEHSLDIVSGSKRKSLAQIELPAFCFINRWAEYQERVDPKCLEKAVKMGLITERNCIYFSDEVIPHKTGSETLELIQYAETIFDSFHFGSLSYNTHEFKNPVLFEVASSSSMTLMDDE